MKSNLEGAGMSDANKGVSHVSTFSSMPAPLLIPLGNGKSYTLRRLGKNEWQGEYEETIVSHDTPEDVTHRIERLQQELGVSDYDMGYHTRILKLAALRKKINGMAILSEKELEGQAV